MIENPPVLKIPPLEDGIRAMTEMQAATHAHLSGKAIILYPPVQIKRKAAGENVPYTPRHNTVSTSPIVRSTRFDVTEKISSTQLEVGQKFSIEGRDGIFTVKAKSVDPRYYAQSELKPPAPTFWIVVNHAGIHSFHTSQYPTVIRIKADAEPVPTQPTRPHISPLQALEIACGVKPSESIIQLPTVLASIGKPITALTQEDFQAGNLPTLDETIAAWNSNQISTQQYKAIRNAIGLHRDPEMFLAVEEMIHETA